MWDGVLNYYQEFEPYLQTQLGNPNGPDAPNKKYYDPRAWLRRSEEYFVARLSRACEELNNIDTLG
jgi:fructose-bisphosphate aldolase, class II